MSYQQKENRKPIGKIIQERSSSVKAADTRIRPSKDFTFYGVTPTRSGEPEISLALKIIKATGEQLIIQYHELVSPMRFDGASRITLSTTTLKIAITGKHLDNIIDYLSEHRLVWIKEPDSDFFQTNEGEVVIEKIDIEEK